MNKLNDKSIDETIKNLFENYDELNEYMYRIFICDTMSDWFPIDNREMLKVINVLNKHKKILDIRDTGKEKLFLGDFSTIINVLLLAKLSKFIKITPKFTNNIFLKTDLLTKYYILHFFINNYLEGEDDGSVFKEEVKKDIGFFLNAYFIYVDDDNFDFFLQEDLMDFISKNNLNFVKISLNSVFDVEIGGLKYGYTDTLNYACLDKKESKILYTLRKPEYEAFNIRKKKGELHLLEGELNFLGDEKKFIDLIKRYPDGDIIGKNYRGKTQKFIVKEKIKLEEE